jgi:hypothetical protein
MTTSRSPGPQFRRPAGQIAPRVAELDPLVQAQLEEALAFTRQGHQALHDASSSIQEAICSGQASIAESARRELVRACTAAAQALANL